MIMQIEYETAYTGNNYYFYDSEKETEEEARYNIQADKWSPNSFSVDAFGYQVLAKLIEQIKVDTYEKGRIEGFIEGMSFKGAE